MDIEERLRRRYWLREQFDWLIQEAIFHKEMRRNFSDRKIVLWRLGESDGKAIIDEAASGSEQV